jgi:hypothetical protein
MNGACSSVLLCIRQTGSANDTNRSPKLPKTFHTVSSCSRRFSAYSTCELGQEAVAQTYSSSVGKTEVPHWLEMTRWPRYFNGLDMTKVAPLAYMPNLLTEPILAVLGEGFDRIIVQAYLPICEDRISVFDQAKINSFITDRSSKQEPIIMVKP